MNTDDNIWDKFAWVVISFILFIIVCLIGLLGWGFIEIIQWITSK